MYCRMALLNIGLGQVEGVLGDIVAFNYLTHRFWGHLEDIIELTDSLELELNGEKS